MSDQAKADADGGWKDVIEDFVEEFFAFYFPEIHAAVDFSVPVKFLDKELRQIVTESEVSGREADKLMEVWLRDGRTEWLLVHVEVQGYRDRDFAERMFIYNYRVFDRYKRDVISLAVLTDSDPGFRPTEYRRDLLGSAVSFTFPTVKLIDYSPEELEASGSPFALVTQIQLEYLSAGSDQERRYDAKVALTLRLYDRGYSREQILRLYRFLDFVLRLREDLAIQYRQRLESIEGDLKMPYVTSVERLAKNEGRAEGGVEGPFPGSDSTHSFPPCLRMILLHNASPTPEPSYNRMILLHNASPTPEPSYSSEPCRRSKGRKIFSWKRSSTPIPLSPTLKTTWLPRDRAEMVTFGDRSGERNFRALPMRF